MMIVIISVSLHQFSRVRKIAGVMKNSGFPVVMAAAYTPNSLAGVLNGAPIHLSPHRCYFPNHLNKVSRLKPASTG
ncbi:MAG: hypothetical protein PHY16_10285 [Methylobacter sp.]|nr:hypothetical protein [Methylobacter sp.]